MMTVTEYSTIILIILLAIFWVCIGPWLLIWAINALFGTNIVFGFKTWLASVVLTSLFNSRSFKK